jgi:hypothetical protein
MAYDGSCLFYVAKGTELNGLNRKLPIFRAIRYDRFNVSRERWSVIALSGSVVASCLLMLLPFGALASCLDEAGSFSERICGEISNRGSSELISGSGALSAEAKGLIARMLGSAQGDVKVDAAVSTYNNVIRDELAKEHANARECKVKMVDVAVAKVCAPPRRSETTVCMGNGGGPSCAGRADVVYNCATYRGMGGGSQVTVDTLKQRFCDSADKGKVTLIYDVGGGECGWTAFKVTCNP